MYYALNFYPQLEAGLAQAITAIRRQYDPTVDHIKPHITVLFPVPATVGEASLTNHILNVLRDWQPFEIRLGGLLRSPDHWLFLTLAQGKDKVIQLYRSLYTGSLAEYRREDIELEPHLALGLFIKKGSTYDWNNPQAAEFDQARYDDASRQARELPLESPFTVDKLHLVAIPDEVLEWATGQRATIPPQAQLKEVREFQLSVC